MKRQAEARHHADKVATIMGRTVADYHGFRLFVRCQACGRETTTKVNDLPERIKPILWSKVVARLKCLACGDRPSEVRVRHRVADWWLLGNNPKL